MISRCCLTCTSLRTAKTTKKEPVTLNFHLKRWAHLCSHVRKESKSFFVVWRLNLAWTLSTWCSVPQDLRSIAKTGKGTTVSITLLIMDTSIFSDGSSSRGSGTKKATMGQHASTSRQRGVLTRRLTSFSNAQTFTKRRRPQGQNHWRGRAHYLKTIIPSKRLRQRLTKLLPGKGRSMSMNKREMMELQQYSMESGLTTFQSWSSSEVMELISILSAKYRPRSACVLYSGQQDEAIQKYLNTFYHAMKKTSEPSALANCQALSPSLSILLLITVTPKFLRFSSRTVQTFLPRTTGQILVSTLRSVKIK